MFENITPEHSAALDAVIRAPRTVRTFSAVPPGRKAIEAIVQSGLLAPFAALAVAGIQDFRKIFVIQGGSPAMETAAGILKRRIAEMAEELEGKVGSVPYVNFLKRMGQRGVPGVGNAPYYIIAGEKKGMPPVAAQSLCYCLHNMWLKATSLGIGFQLVSVTMQMDSDPEFCKFLSIPCGKYALDGCAIGFPSDQYQPPSVKYPTLANSVRWL